VLPLLAQPALGQQNPPKIVDIIVLGNKSINKEAIITASHLKIGDSLTQQSIDEARRQIMAMGFWGARLAEPTDGVKVKAEVNEGTAKVVVEVDENDKVNKIVISGT